MDNENNNEQLVISQYAFERMQAKEERESLFKNIIIVVLIILLVVTNAAWLYVWNQYDWEEYSIDIDTGDGGDANYIGNDGDITYGSDNSTQAAQNTP